MSSAAAALSAMFGFARDRALPSGRDLAEASRGAVRAMEGVPSSMRPRSSGGRPGSLVRLPGDRDVYILPDLHARPGLLPLALSTPAASGKGSIADDMADGKAFLVALGDLMHSETDADLPRWRRAYDEYLDGWRISDAMAEEMALGLAVSMQILTLVAAFPDAFACLKGNHDNCVNETARGDSGFRKYVREGEMAASFLDSVYGKDTMAAYRAFELALPLVAAGPRFAASHAEPALPLSLRDIVDARVEPEREREIVHSLIWTRDDTVPEGNVGAILDAIVPDPDPRTRWIAGHRPVEGTYALGARGRLVQIHARGKARLAVVRAGDFFKPERDVIDITGGDLR